MSALVTGVAGFVGSHLAESLLHDGQAVRGVDCFTDYYATDLKRANIATLTADNRFELIESDLGEAPIAPLVRDVDVVYHLAAQPGVRASWGRDFEIYVRRNVLATQRLLEGCVASPPPAFVYASSSSVYGDAESLPTLESAVPRPISPYGVTKLAAENLCELYRTGFGIPTASLRLFTVYGPRQRPDMAFAKLIAAAVQGRTFELYGDGEQTRDFTYVGDVVRALRDCAAARWTGIANIGGGARVSMNEVISSVASLTRAIQVDRIPTQRGDVRHTAADVSVARAAFGYEPSISLLDGLNEMVAWERWRAAS